MKYEIKESQLLSIVSEEYDKLVKEGYIPSTAFNGFSTEGGESGILVANEKLSDFITYVEKTPGVFENLPPMLKGMYQDAKNYFDAYPHLDKNQKPMGEGIVDKFTPYTPEEREQNFIPFTSKDTRTPFEKNPSYERALKAAQERKRQKELEKQNGVKTESKQQIHVTKDDITEAINQVLKEYDDGGSNGDYEAEQSVFRMGRHLYEAEHHIKLALEETYDSRENYRKTGEYMYEGGKDELYGIYNTLTQYIKGWEEANSFYLD